MAIQSKGLLGKYAFESPIDPKKLRVKGESSPIIISIS